MPIFWNYLLGRYLKVLLLCITSFIAVLLVSRLEEIAHIAALGTSKKLIAKFTLYQIPYILPIAIPVSCLISSFILFNDLSTSFELLALRASGLSIFKISLPVLVTALFLGASNFFVASELSTTAHLATRKMVHQLSNVNPLMLLQNTNSAKLRGAYVQMEPLQSGKEAKNCLFSITNRGSRRLNLIFAKHVHVDQGALLGEDVTLISSFPSLEQNSFDHLVIENQKNAVSKATNFATLLKKQGWKLSNDHLKLSLLKARLKALKSEEVTPLSKRNIQKCLSEFVRRLSITLAPLSFTLLGVAFGTEIGRHEKKRGLVTALIGTTLAFTCFFIGKECDTHLWIATIFFILPHCILGLASFLKMRAISQGVE